MNSKLFFLRVFVVTAIAMLLIAKLSNEALADLGSIRSVGGSKYQAIVDGEVLSTHNTQHKAVQKVIKTLELDCVGTCEGYVRQSFELLITVNGDVEVGEEPVDPTDPNKTYTVVLSWNIPTKREDGSTLLLSDIKHYEIEVTTASATTNDSNTMLYNVLQDQESLSLELNSGNYKFRIRTISELEGNYSDYIALEIP